MCETKYEDGIWFGRYEDGEGDFAARFVVNGRTYALRSPKGDYKIETPRFQPIRRVADLEGRPVVEASVIEAIVKDIQKTENKLLDTSLLIEVLTAILHDRLAARKDENNDEVAAPTTEGDGLAEFLRKLGAFPCWNEAGMKRTAWKCPDGYGVLFEDGSVRSYTAEFFDRFFTRTSPHPLSPELESLVKPLAEKLGKTETEVRDAILAAQGAGAC